MPKIEINGVNIAYELAGEGPPLVWTPGGRTPRKPITYAIAGRFSSNYKVLTWDRRNSGFSDIAITDAENEWHAYTDDLHHLLRRLNMSPAFIGGGSGGCIVSLLMAHRYPEDVKGLILHHPPTDDPELHARLLEGWYLFLAEAAEKGDMEAVISKSADKSHEYSMLTQWVADSIARNPDNRDRFLSMDPGIFALTMRRWANAWSPSRAHLAGLPDDEVKNIKAPAQISHGINDNIHPVQTARKLFELLPNAEWVDYSSRYSAKEIQVLGDAWASGDLGWSTYCAFYAPFFEDFLHRVESNTFKPNFSDKCECKSLICG